MIDAMAEYILSLKEAARFLPVRRAGKRPHVSCIYRWTTSGCRGVILESLQIGGTRCTSREALARFFEQLTTNAGCCPAPIKAPVRSIAKRSRDSEAAAKELDRLLGPSKLHRAADREP